MDGYRHIVVALDLSDECAPIARRAADLAARYGAGLTLLHVVEALAGDPANTLMVPAPIDLEAEMVEGSLRRLEELAHGLGLDKADRRVEVGTTKAGILKAVSDTNADLIVVGSHGRHGIALLLGSTANAVLHGAPCDVLAVRVG